MILSGKKNFRTESSVVARPKVKQVRRHLFKAPTTHAEVSAQAGEKESYLTLFSPSPKNTYRKRGKLSPGRLPER